MMEIDQELTEATARFAIYTRISTNMQTELSLDSQAYECSRAIEQRGGVVVATFSDSGKSGWSLDRDGFNDLRVAAQKGEFDAVMVWKFDRLARNQDHALMIKSLLRIDYGLKLYCVEGFSEDDDDSEYTAMMEQMLAVFSAYYSQTVSTDAKRMKRHRALNGEFNGSIPPLGYDLVKVSHATPAHPAGLYINPRQAAIVRRAFRMYATGEYSDADIAAWMNTWKVIQDLRQGRKPANKDMIRELLQNRVYTGRVLHADTLYKDGIRQPSKLSRRGRGEWFEGKHQGFISDDLFEECQRVRKGSASIKTRPNVYKTYIFGDRVFCARCMARQPEGLVHIKYGRMRPHFHQLHRYASYWCLSHDYGYDKCGQVRVQVDRVDQQVIAMISNLTLPDAFREQVEQAVAERIENAVAVRRMAEIQRIVQRIDLSWQTVGLDSDVFLKKRSLLHDKLDLFRPIQFDEFKEAAYLIYNFRDLWEECQRLDNPDEGRQKIISRLVEQVYVYDKDVIGVVLFGGFAVISNKTKELPQDLEKFFHIFI